MKIASLLLAFLLTCCAATETQLPTKPAEPQMPRFSLTFVPEIDLQATQLVVCEMKPGALFCFATAEIEPTPAPIPGHYDL